MALYPDVVEVRRVDMRRRGEAKTVQQIFPIINLAVVGLGDAAVLLGVSI